MADKFSKNELLKLVNVIVPRCIFIIRLALEIYVGTCFKYHDRILNVRTTFGVISIGYHMNSEVISVLSLELEGRYYNCYERGKIMILSRE